MFESRLAQLDQALAGLVVPCDGTAVTAFARVVDRATAMLAAAVDQLDRAGQCQADGAVSPAGWLVDKARMSRAAANRLARVGHLLGRSEAITEAACSGRLTGGQLDAAASHLSDETVDVFDASGLLPRLEGLSVPDTTRVLRRFQAHAHPDGNEPDGRVGVLHHSLVGDRWSGCWTLDAEAGAVVDEALRRATTEEQDGEPRRSPAHRRADALVDICRRFLAHGPELTRAPRRPVVTLVGHVDTHGVGALELVPGQPLPRAVRDRVLCDPAVRRILLDSSSAVIDVGHTSRTTPPALWAALVVRDQGCRFPGCDRDVRWSEAHHVIHWEHGGPTTFDNLVVLCTRHHHLVHMPGWHTKLLPDGTVEVTFPDGRTRASHPPGALGRGTGPPDDG